MVSVPLTEGNNRNFARGPPLSSLFLISLVKLASVPLTEWNNRNVARGSPTELYFYGFVYKWDRVATRPAGVWIDFHFPDLFLRLLSPNSISMIRIVEYSTISVLEYFGDTLANVRLECDSDCVTRIKNKSL